MPLALNPVPDAVTLEIVTFEFPLLVSVAPSELLPPTLTVPKPRLVGLMPRVKVAAIPVPFRPTEVGEPGALLTIERLPDTAPAVVGRKATVIVVCCPAATFKGSENPLTLKTETVGFTWVMVRAAEPVFLMIKVWDKLVPTT